MKIVNNSKLEIVNNSNMQIISITLKIFKFQLKQV